MKMKRIYTFTDEELRQLVNDSTSRVFIKKSVLHISLHAYHFADLKQSLCEVFDESINNFKSELGGIVLSYRNIKVLNNIGTIINDDSRIYIDVQADYYVFSPEVGSVLTGIVNKKSNDHVGCLVHKLFNVSIPRPEEGSWEGETVEIGQKISFMVEYMDFDLNLPYIRGKLVDSSSHPELGEKKKKKKKKKKKNKFKDEEQHLDSQPAEAQANQGNDEQEDSAEQQQNINKKKKKDKKDRKYTENLNQEETLLMINAQDNGESENLPETLEDRLISKSSGETLTESVDWNLSRDFSDISVLACSTQKDEMPPKKKKKKKKVKDLDVIVGNDNNTIDNNEVPQELMNSSHREELLDTNKKKKRKLFTNSEDLMLKNNEDADQELAAKKKPKKHKKHKQLNAGISTESGEIPLQNNKPEECEMTTKILTNASYGTQQNNSTNVNPGKTRILGSSEICETNSAVNVDISNKDTHIETTTSKKNDIQASSAILQSPSAKTGKNFNNSVNYSITHSSDPEMEASKRKLSEAELGGILSPKKKKSIRFSTEISKIHLPNDAQADSEQVELDKEKISNKRKPEADEDESSSFISGSSVSSPFNSSIYSGAGMVNFIDRKRKKKVKASEDVATLKRPMNKVSPSLISSTRTLLQHFSEQNIRDPTVLGLSPPSNSEEIKEESFQRIPSPSGKTDSGQDSLSSSPSKPLTQKERVSSQSRIATGEKLNALDANVSEGFNSKINLVERLDLSPLTRRLSSSESADPQMQEQASKSPKPDKQKKKKRKKKEETVSKDFQPANHNITDTGENLNDNISAGFNTKNATELLKISQLIARFNAENAVAQKQEQSLKSPKADQDKEMKTKKKEVEDSTKSKHKEHKKDKKNKDKNKEDKGKKEKVKNKKDPKTNKEKKKKGGESDLTDLSRKLLQDFLKKQNS